MKNEPPWDDLDPPIVPLVRLLRGGGLETQSSCQGGEGHGFGLPTVICAAEPDTLDGLGLAALRTLQDAGWSGFSIERVLCYGKAGSERPTGAFVHVVVWSLEGQPE